MLTDLGVTAVVLTYRRPRLATQVVRGLLEREGFPADRVLLLINGEGGLEDSSLESQVDVLRLPQNLGPAGGYRQALEHLFSTSDASWFYLCEDDIGLLDLPHPRVKNLIREAEAIDDSVGAIVAYGRDLDDRTGITTPHLPRSSEGFEDVDVAAWGASLLSRRVLEAGIFPDPDWFFGFEDFDFWLRVRKAGFQVLLDAGTASRVAQEVFDDGRNRLFAGVRPRDSEEPWRQYYMARNFLELRRRHGQLSWTLMHLLKSARRFQRAGSREGRMAVCRGLIDGFLGRLGKNPRYSRDVGEHGGTRRTQGV